MDRIKQVDREDNERLFKENVDLKRMIKNQDDTMIRLDNEIRRLRQIIDYRDEEIKSLRNYQDTILLTLSKYQDTIPPRILVIKEGESNV